MAKPKIVLVIGARHSGTSLLAAYLGRHPEISMMFEDNTGRYFQKQYGTPYVGNKLVLHDQIREQQRANITGYAFNRLYAHLYGKDLSRPYPTSKLSLDDYLDSGARVIAIRRDINDNLQSILRRTPETKSKTAMQYLYKCFNTIAKYEREKKIHTLWYDDLVRFIIGELESVCAYLDIDYSDAMLEGEKCNWGYV